MFKCGTAGYGADVVPPLYRLVGHFPLRATMSRHFRVTGRILDVLRRDQSVAKAMGQLPGGYVFATAISRGGGALQKRIGSVQFPLIECNYLGSGCLRRALLGCM